MGNIALLVMAKLLSNTQNKADYTGIVNCTCSCFLESSQFIIGPRIKFYLQEKTRLSSSPINYSHM